jgi:integrase
MKAENRHGAGGSVFVRVLADGGKRYDAVWRVHGKLRQQSFKQEQEAKRHLVNTLKKLQGNGYRDVKGAPMGDVFDRWLEDSLAVRVNEGSLKPSTAKSYRNMVKTHLRPAFADYRSDRLNTAAVEVWRAGIARKIAEKTLAPKYYVNLRNLLHTILEWARRRSPAYLDVNPVDDLERLNLPTAKKRPHFEPEQVAALLKAAAASPPDDTIIRVALYSGLRRGELFALKWEDVEAGNGQDGGRIHVRRSIYQGAISTPKTADSDRVVDVPQPLLDDLAVYRVMYPPVGEGYIFRTSQGRPLDPDAWHRERMVPILTTASLRLPMTGLHSLRHTYVSLLAALGEDTRYIADQVGHSTTRLTEDLYCHVFSKVRTEAMRRLGAVMRSNKNPTNHQGTPSNTVEQYAVSIE